MKLLHNAVSDRTEKPTRVKYIEELDATGLLRKRSSAGKTFYSGMHDSRAASA